MTTTSSWGERENQGEGDPVPYFIGVVPPAEDQQRIRQFRERWGASRQIMTGPHVTVKSQSGLTTTSVG